MHDHLSKVPKMHCIIHDQHSPLFVSFCRSKKRSLEEILENQNGTNQTTSGSKIAENDIQIQTGTGRITSSGTTIHGHYTDFMSQLSVGDAIIITHPTT